MDSAPLTKAHDHATAASVATNSPTTESTVAVNEHVLAAGEFAKAAAVTTSLEALRTIKLLEEHHRRLAELLRIPLDQSPPQSRTDTDAPNTIISDEKAVSSSGDSGDRVASEPKTPKSEQASPTGAAKVATSTSPPPTLPSHQRRYTASRDLSSSIASNLASARGIRSRYRGQPASPSVSKEQAPGNVEVRPRREGSNPQSLLDQAGGKPSWVPPSPERRSPRADTSRHLGRETSTMSEDENSAKGTASEEGFSRFYNTFGSIFNRLSAPLAFAGLPLIAEESGLEPSSGTAASAAPPPEPHSAARRGRMKSPQPSPREPDLSAIYSRAALRAISRDSHGPNDSFYVVPTSGHTVSYANILHREDKERRRLEASTSALHPEDELLLDDDDFVDARETPVPLQISLQHHQPGSSGGTGAFAGLSAGARVRLGRSKTDRDVQNVVEELHLENASLKDMLDKVSKRLHAFELNSQTSHLALAQSLRLGRPGSPLSNSGGVGGGGGGGAGAGDVAEATDEAGLQRKNHDLEEQLAAAAKQMEALEKEYSRSQVTLEKYREKWEKLKAGARARREQTQTDPGEPSRSRR